MMEHRGLGPRPRVSCLAFHTRGECYSNCTRLLGHGTLSADEQKGLQEFLEKGLAKVEGGSE